MNPSLVTPGVIGLFLQLRQASGTLYHLILDIVALLLEMLFISVSCSSSTCCSCIYALMSFLCLLLRLPLLLFPVLGCQSIILAVHLFKVDGVKNHINKYFLLTIYWLLIRLTARVELMTILTSCIERLSCSDNPLQEARFQLETFHARLQTLTGIGPIYLKH